MTVTTRTRETVSMHIRNVPKPIWRRFKIAATQVEKSMTEAAMEAFEAWAERVRSDHDHLRNQRSE